MNILTFDIEEWFLNYRRNGSKEKNVEFDRYLDEILIKLDERQIKATFFCVGEMGRLFPDVIRKIYTRGHEIGCHSNVHTWLNKMSEDECRQDTRQAIDSIEQCIGEKVKSYRAPAFSIAQKNKWAFDILVENGIERDASIFPASRSFGGFVGFGQKTPCIVENNGNRIKEFPVCMTSFLGKEVAYSGGGYFRFFPLKFVRSRIAMSDYTMCYFHIGDLVPESRGVMSKEAYEAYFKEKGTVKARYMRYFKANFGKKNAMPKMMQLIDDVKFVSLRQADDTVIWSQANILTL